MSTDDIFRFSAIGTDWTISSDRTLPNELRSHVLALAEDFDRVWSRFRGDALVWRIAHSDAGGRFDFPTRDIPLLELYDRLVVATNGALDPLVGRDLELLGYDADYSLSPDWSAISVRIREDSWSKDVHREGNSLFTEKPLVIDVGAAGKGYLIDLIGQLLVESGTERFTVDGSGDLKHRDSESLRVGLEHPTAPGRVIGVANLGNAALCASATSRRSWGQGLHHILDGRTGKPVQRVVATWAIAADAATADGLATALFLSEAEDLEAFSFKWVRMLADGRIQWSNGFDGELFL